ncbi:MAG: CDP-alcohol phosphatidyltransferase family protein [Candidatus Thermoplasmatota archaeon]|nr:CDP-alcohol phosphatidyltransferase family protein [Candidatus Thermoplasmatota archaeon]
MKEPWAGRRRVTRFRGRERMNHWRERLPRRLTRKQRQDRVPKPILKLISPADIFTLMNFLCGVLAVMNSVDGGDGFRKAMYLIVLGMLFDGLDGPIARKFGSSHRFGVWLDSLADAATFCIAPAILVYNMFKDPSGSLFVSWQGFVAILSSVCLAMLGILRLARFSFYAHKWKDFIGLPTPAMALIVVCISACYYWSVKLEIEIEYLTSGQTVVLPLLFLFLSFTMVADLRYRKFRGKIMYLEGTVLLLLIVSLLVGFEDPVIGLTGSLAVSLIAFMYLITPLFGGRGRIWGASKWADLVDEEDVDPYMDHEEGLEGY